MTEENEDRKFPVAKVINIPEQRHKGKIVNIDIRQATKKSSQETFEYVDFYMSVDDVEGLDDFQLRLSVPTYISLNSKFGKLLLLLGMEVEEGKELQLSQIKEHCISKQVSYVTTNETSESGTFARIVEGSLKLAEETPVST